MRLNKFLSTCGVSSRRKSEQYILDGRVKVNGVLVTDLSIQVNEKKDVVTLDDAPLSLPNAFVYLKLNKPKGYACTSSDEHGRKTIFSLLPDEYKTVRLFNVGRLDYDSEGLIFLTNDGDFANRVISPKFHYEKEYIVTAEGQFVESEFAVLRKGVVIDGVKMPPAKIRPIAFDGKFTKISVVITEGMNHQVRRMFEAIGRDIKLLKRVRIGEVHLGNLYRGKVRKMTEAEVMSFWENKD